MFYGSEYVETLQSAILIKHNCKPTHKETVFVQEKTGDNEIIWEGHVEVFDLTGHEQSKICYAWQHTDVRGNTKFFTVLKNQLVVSPRRAVQVAIFTGIQPLVRKSSDDLELFRAHLEESEQLCRKMGIMTEDLDASIQAARGIKEKIKRNGIFRT